MRSCPYGIDASVGKVHSIGKQHERGAGFMALSHAVSPLPGVQDKHIHALFRFLDVHCAGALPPDELADAIYGPPAKAQAELVRYAFQVREPSLFEFRCFCGSGCRC